MHQNDPPRLSPFDFGAYPDPYPASNFDADPDSAFHFFANPDLDPASQNDADPSAYGSASNTASNLSRIIPVVRKEDSRYL
jgi:hypothetical protein